MSFRYEYDQGKYNSRNYCTLFTNLCSTYLGLRLCLVLADEGVLQPVHLVGFAMHQDHVGRLEGADEAARLPAIESHEISEISSSSSSSSSTSSITYQVHHSYP